MVGLTVTAGMTLQVVISAAADAAVGGLAATQLH